MRKTVRELAKPVVKHQAVGRAFARRVEYQGRETRRVNFRSPGLHNLIENWSVRVAMSLSDEKGPLLPKTALEAAEPVPPPTKENKDHKHLLGIPPQALAGLSYCTASAGALA